MNCTLFHDVEIGERNIIGAASVIGKSTNAGEVFITKPTEVSKWTSEQFARLM